MSKFVKGSFDSPYTYPSFFNTDFFVVLDFEIVDGDKVYYALIRSSGDNLHKVYIRAVDYFILTGDKPDDSEL